MEDMKQLMTSENGEYFSDFTLCLNGRDIKAHKVCYSALCISDIGKLFEFNEFVLFWESKNNSHVFPSAFISSGYEEIEDTII